ncbi:YqeB family protein [Georgenia sp. Z1491]|uniref:YqeB family protein n=1 Tax=Georgenia sp. Z1491 TaxID=3416707 RepID=UPI003CE8A0D6
MTSTPPAATRHPRAPSNRRGRVMTIDERTRSRRRAPRLPQLQPRPAKVAQEPTEPERAHVTTIDPTTGPADESARRPPAATRVRARTGRRLSLAVGLPLGGAVVGALLALVVELVAHLTAFGGVLGYGDRLGEPVALLVGVGLGVVLGAVVAAAALRETMRAEVSDRSLSITWDDARVCVPRALVGTIVLGEDLVVLGRGGVELARLPLRLSEEPLRRALVEHGYPEPQDDDPHEDDFRTWTEGDALDDATARLLAARAAAVQDGQHGDAELLRRQLARRGVMVRDRGSRPAQQQWRRVVGRGTAAAA